MPSLPESLEELPCRRNAFAGTLIGATCGFLFGTAEAGKNAGLTTSINQFMVKMRDPVVMRFFFRQQLGTTAMFAGMFATYQTVSCLVSEQGVDRPVAVASGAVAGVVPFLPNRLFRRSLPWALVLVGMDVYSGGIKS